MRRGDLGRELRYAYLGQNYKVFTFFWVMWQAIEWKDSYHGQAWLLSDYDEVSNIPVVCDFEVTGLEMEQWSDPARVAEVVTKKLSAVVDAAVAEEHDRWLTMLAYLGKVED